MRTRIILRYFSLAEVGANIPFDGNAWPDNIPFLIGRRLTWLRCWLRNNYVRSSCGSECNQVGLLFRRRRIERIAVKMHG